MYKDKKILILGLARSGYAVAKLLSKMGANITVNEINDCQDEDVISELTNLGIKIILGDHPVNLLDNVFDLIVKNPGIPLNHIYIRKAIVMEIPITTEIEVAYNCMQDANFIAITGTNGKTTTATLIYEMLNKSGRDVHLVGNIGNPISNYYDVYNSETIFVVEISAQQLHDCITFKPDIAILTNLSEAHMEFFDNLDIYYKMKKSVFQNMLDSDIAIINASCKESLELTYNIVPLKKYFSVSEKVDGAYIIDNLIYYENSIFNISDITLVGNHNYENIMCSIIVAKSYGVLDDVIRDVLHNFKGVSHRIEFVRQINNIKYYNDSKSTNILSCKVALDAFKTKTTLILGGLERGQNFNDLLLNLNYVTRIYCYGETKDRIKSVMDDFKIECIVCVDLQDAIIKAHERAFGEGVILFSPACASWDEFDNYEQRGDLFKLIVNSFKS
ncbi:MAG: UDP-N-acetylmuramoyl-L-alanine--D-glutamate ligase [Bacilli bacterium]